MAKNRRDDFDDAPAEHRPGGTEQPSLESERSALLAEREAHLAEIAQLQALLAQQKRNDPGFDAPEGKSADYWEVQLTGGPTHVVQARDAANARDTFRREMGVVTSEFREKIEPSDREKYRAAQARRFGRKPEEWPLPGDPPGWPNHEKEAAGAEKATAL